jgi:hypothetical protein
MIPAGNARQTGLLRADDRQERTSAVAYRVHCAG